MLSNDYEATLKEDIEVIESKRQLLEQLVAVTQAIEQMQESLQAVLILGASSKEISEHALNFYNRTSNSFKNLPVTKLQEYHQNLDAVIRSQLKSILHFSDITCCSSEAVEVLHIAYGEENENPLLMIEEFKRTAQTAVSLKILLRKRVCPPPVPFCQCSRRKSRSSSNFCSNGSRSNGAKSCPWSRRCMMTWSG